MADGDLQPTRTISNLVPATTEQNLDPAIYHDPALLDNPNQPSIGVSVAPIGYTSMQHQADFIARQQEADLSTKLEPLKVQISLLEQKVSEDRERRDKSIEDHRQELEAARAEALALKKSQEGLLGGAYRTLNIGLDKYNSDLASQQKELNTYKSDLREAQDKQDTEAIAILIPKIEDSSKNLRKLSELDPFSDEGKKLYPFKSETIHYIQPPTYASGYGVGGYIGYGEKGAARRDILEGTITGGVVGASTPETRSEAIRQAQQEASKGKETPDITKDYVDSVVARFEKNPFDESLNQTDRAIASAYRQVADTTGNYTISGYAGIAERLAEAAGISPAAATAIVLTAPKAQGSASYQGIMNIINAQKTSQDNLRAQIITQEQAARVQQVPVIAKSPEVELGGFKKPFISTAGVEPKAGEVRTTGLLDNVRNIFASTPLGATLIGTPEEKAKSEVIRQKISKAEAIAAPALIVGGGGIKLPAIEGLTTKAGGFIDTLFGAKPIGAGISTSALVGGTLTLGTGKFYESGKPAFSGAIPVIPEGGKELTIKELAGKPAKTGLFGVNFFKDQVNNPQIIEQAQLKGAFAGGLTKEDLMGGASSKNAEDNYAKLMATYGDISQAAKIKTPSGENYYLIVGSKGQYQIRGDLVGNERWSADLGEGAFNQLMKDGVDPIATIIARERNPDATIKFGQEGSEYSSVRDFQKAIRKNSIDLNDPVEIQAFADKNTARGQAMTALQLSQQDAYSQVLAHRYEKEHNLAVGSLSLSDYFKATAEKQTIGDTIQTINKALNPIGASAYEGVALNSKNPFENIQFNTSKSEKIAGIFSTLDGSPLTKNQEYIINREKSKLPIEDQVVADQFLGLYNQKNTTYEKLNDTFKGYNPDDGASKKELLNEIQIYSQYDPEGAQKYLQIAKDMDVGQEIIKNNLKITDLSANTSPYAFNMVLKNGKLEPSPTLGGKLDLEKALADQDQLIAKIKTPSLQLQYKELINDATTYGVVKRELSNPDPSGIRDFNKLVDGLDFIPKEQKDMLKTQYVDSGQAKTLSEKADKLAKDIPRYGATDTEISDLKQELKTNSVLNQTNPETGKTYADEIGNGLDLVRKNVWTPDDYKKATGGFDILTTAGLSLREQAAQERQTEGVNPFNLAKNFVGSLISAPQLTVYGTIRASEGLIGGTPAQEVQQQSKKTDVVLPTYNLIESVGEPVFGQHITKYTEPYVPALQVAGKIIGETAASAILSPSLARETGAADYAGRFTGAVLSEPARRPFAFAVSYGTGSIIGKVFEGISAAKTGLLITPRLAAKEVELTGIVEELGKNRPLAYAERIKPASTTFPTESLANPLARKSATSLSEAYAAEEASKAATRQALYQKAIGIEKEKKYLGYLDTAIDVGIALPFVVPMAGDIISKAGNPEELGKAIGGTYIPMTLGGTHFIGERTITTAKLGEAGAGASGFESTMIGLRTKSGSVESFSPVLAITKSPTEGVRIPFTSKEYGYDIKLLNPLSKESAPTLFNLERDIQPAKKTFDPDTEAFYLELVKEFGNDAKAQAEIPALTKTKRTIKTDALTQEMFKEIRNVNKETYRRLPAGELELIAELSARYKNIGEFENGITPSGKIVPTESGMGVPLDSGVLSAELVRSGKLPEVNKLSPLGKQILYETILDANLGKPQTPLARALLNAEDRVSGRSSTYNIKELNQLPTNNERVFGEVRLENVNPATSRILYKFLKDREAHNIKEANDKIVKIETRVSERREIIDKVERDILQSGRAIISRRDVNILGLDLKPDPTTGKYYIDVNDFNSVKKAIKIEEDNLLWLGEHREKALNVDFNKYFSREAIDVVPQRGGQERAYLSDQFAKNIDITYTSTPKELIITNIDKKIVNIPGEKYATVKQYSSSEMHLHPRETPPSAFDIQQIFETPSFSSLLEVSAVKTPELNIVALTHPTKLGTGGKQWLSWTKPDVKNFYEVLDIGQKKIEQSFERKGIPPQAAEKALMDQFFDEAFLFRQDAFKLRQEKAGSPIKLNPEHMTRVNAEISKSMSNLRELEKIREQSVVIKPEAVKEIKLSEYKKSTAEKIARLEKEPEPIQPVKETKGITELKEGVSPRDAFFIRRDVKKVGEYYETPLGEKAIIPEVKERSPTTAPEIGKFYTPTEQKIGFEKAKAVREKYVEPSYAGLNRFQRLAEAERFRLSGGIGKYYTAVESERAIIPKAGQSPKEVGVVGKYYKNILKRQDVGGKTPLATSADFKTRMEGKEVVEALKKANIEDLSIKRELEAGRKQAEERPESKKISLIRSLQKDTSGVGLNYTKYIKPEIANMLKENNVPNSDAVAGEILKGLESYDSTIYGSVVQSATKRMLVEKKLPYQPPISRTARDLDIHMKRPQIAAYDLVDRINKKAKDDVVRVSEDGNVEYTPRYAKEKGQKLFDLHDKDIGTGGLGGEEYLGHGIRPEKDITITRKPFIMEGGSLEALTISSQAARKAKSSQIFGQEVRTVKSESGLSTTGSMTPEPFRLNKDIADEYAIRLFQADLIQKESPRRAEKVRAEVNEWVDLFGENVAKDARKKATESKTAFLNEIGYNVNKKSVSTPISNVISKSGFTQVSQKKQYSSGGGKPSQSLKYVISKPSSLIVSPSKSPTKSQISSTYASSSIISRISPSPSISPSISPSLIRSISPSPSPSPSRSPSISPSPSPSRSPSISPSPSPSRYSPSPSYRYSYDYTFKTPPFLLGGIGGGGGGDEVRRKRVRRFKIKQPIALGEQLFTGVGLPSITFNLGGSNTKGFNEQNFNIGGLNKKKMRKLYG